MKKVAIVFVVFGALIAAPAMAAAPTPVPSWTGFYVGAEFGDGWSGAQAVDYSPEDRAALLL